MCFFLCELCETDERESTRELRDSTPTLGIRAKLMKTMPHDAAASGAMVTSGLGGSNGGCDGGCRRQGVSAAADQDELLRMGDADEVHAAGKRRMGCR